MISKKELLNRMFELENDMKIVVKTGEYTPFDKPPYYAEKIRRISVVKLTQLIIDYLGVELEIKPESIILKKKAKKNGK